MLTGKGKDFHESHPYVDGSVQAGFIVAAPGIEVSTLGPTRRREGRVAEQKLCTYELCESIDEASVVIQQGEVCSLNRSAHGILMLMGYAPRPHQLLELHIPESLWHRSMNLYEVQWTKPVHVESESDLFLVGCRLTFGPARYLAL